MMAVARELRLQRFQIIMMKESLISLSEESGFVKRTAFDLSLVRAKISQREALEIFDLLFTMWDHLGNQRIPAKMFASGIAPLACSADDLSSALRFSLHINDEHNNGHVLPRDLHNVLLSKFANIPLHATIASILKRFTLLNFQTGIDNTASYFGDAHLEPGDIDSVVEAVFDGRNIAIPYERECAWLLQSQNFDLYVFLLPLSFFWVQ